MVVKVFPHHFSKLRMGYAFRDAEFRGCFRNDASNVTNEISLTIRARIFFSILSIIPQLSSSQGHSWDSGQKDYSNADGN